MHRPIQQDIYARPWAPIDLHVDDATELLALQEMTVGRHGMIAADDYMMKRLGMVCTLDLNLGSSCSERSAPPQINTT